MASAGAGKPSERKPIDQFYVRNQFVATFRNLLNGLIHYLPSPYHNEVSIALVYSYDPETEEGNAAIQSELAECRADFEGEDKEKKAAAAFKEMVQSVSGLIFAHFKESTERERCLDSSLTEDGHKVEAWLRDNNLSDLEALVKSPDAWKHLRTLVIACCSEKVEEATLADEYIKPLIMGNTTIKPLVDAAHAEAGRRATAVAATSGASGSEDAVRGKPLEAWGFEPGGGSLPRAVYPPAFTRSESQEETGAGAETKDVGGPQTTADLFKRSSSEGSSEEEVEVVDRDCDCCSCQ